MWAKLIVSVTLLPVLVHSIFGCCWHHAHSEGSLNCVHSTTETRSCDQHQHGHRHPHDDRSEQNDPILPEPCEHEDSCNGVRCVYLVAEPVQNEIAVDLNTQFAAFDGCCTVILNTVTAPWQNPQRCANAPLPSQRCALTQVWVV